MVANRDLKGASGLCVLYHSKFPPHVFKAAIELSHEGTFSAPLPIKLQDAEMYAQAAIFFNLPVMIEKVVSVNTVWSILDTLFLQSPNPRMIDACKKVLLSHADDCLREKTFRFTSLLTLKWFMDLRPISVQSDVLQMACLQKLCEHRRYFRGFKSPKIKEFLAVILSNLIRLCPAPVIITNVANYTVYFQDSYHLDLLPKEDILKQLELPFCYQVGEKPEMLCLQFKVCVDMFLLGIEMISRKNSNANNKKSSSFMEKLVIQVKVTKEGQEEAVIVFDNKVDGKKKFNSFYNILFPNRLLVCAGSQCEINVVVKQKIQLPVLNKSTLTLGSRLTGRGLLCLEDVNIFTKIMEGDVWIDSSKEANCVISKLCFDLTKA